MLPYALECKKGTYCIAECFRKQERTMTAGRRTRVRWFLSFWLFVLSGVAFLDRTNISIAGLEISREFGLSNQRLGWVFSAFLIGYAGFQLPAAFSPRVTGRGAY